MRITNNILVLQNRYIEQYGKYPTFLVLDSESYLRLNKETGTGPPEGFTFAHFTEGGGGIAMYRGLTIVVIPQIPELCTVVGDPWVEALRP